MKVSNKHICLLTTGLLITCFTSAQIRKGDVLLGGSLQFYQQKAAPDTYVVENTTLGILPNFGKAVKDNVVVGISLGFIYTRQKYNGSPYPSNINKLYTYVLGAYLRSYKSTGGKFALFLEEDLTGYIQRNESYQDGTPPSGVTPLKNTIVRASVSPGLAYFISPHMQLETALTNLVFVQYAHSSDGAYKSNTFQLGSNTSQFLQDLTVGIKWIL